MNKYNQLREEIIKANKDIMELKKDCRFVWLNEELNEETFEIINVTHFEDILRGINSFEIEAVKVDDIHKKIYIFDGYDEDTEQSFIDSVVKIIGRDITLEDVLVSSKKPLAVTNCGLLLVKKDISANARYISSGINWKPNTPLQDQSDACKELLWDLICKE